MRTGSPICGGTNIRGSPSWLPVDIRNRMVSKSPTDVEAVLAIARPSGNNTNDTCIEYERKMAVIGDRESSRTDVQPRFTHVLSAVMPERHSYVQKILKRKIETRMESAAPVLECQAAGDVEESLQKAIESERGYFDSVKRCRLQAEYDVDKHDEPDIGGRFIRTGQPCLTSDDFVTSVSYHDIVSPLVAKRDGVLEITSRDGLSFGKCMTDERNVDRSRPSRADGDIVCERYSPETSRALPAVMRQVYCLARTSMPSRMLNITNAEPSQSKVRSAAAEAAMSESRRNIPHQHHQQQQQNESRVREMYLSRPSPTQREIDIDGRMRNGSLNAYYSLGRQVASKLALPACQPPLNRMRESNGPKLFQRFESRQQYLPNRCEDSKSVYHAGRCRNVTNENRKSRKLDSRTENKVRDGEFGTLRTLRDFYNKLGQQKSEAEHQKSVSRGRLGSISNRRQMHTYYNQPVVGAEDMFIMYPTNITERCRREETAIDLSMHSRREQCSAEETSKMELKVASGLRRRSRSCCSSPNVGLDLVMRTGGEVINDRYSTSNANLITDARAPTNVGFSANSLPASPLSCNSAVDVKLETMDHHSLVERKDDQSGMEKVDSRLPLKKRRFLDVQKLSVDSDSSPSSPQSESSNLVVGSTAVKPERSSSPDNDDVNGSFEYSTLTSAVIHAAEDNLPLHIAIEDRNTEVIDRILDIMARLDMSLNVYNVYKQTPLHIAVHTDQPAVVKKLLDGGASPNQVDQNGCTSVHYAAQLKSSRCLECILDNSTVPVHIHTLSYDGLTALHMAVQCGNFESAKILSNAGARLDGHVQRIPVSHALEQNDVQVARTLLQSRGSNQSLPKYSGCSYAQVTYDTHCRGIVCRPLNAFVAADVKG